ncbi:MAG TPA: hypothetical protein V6D17_21330 [Candidatus Obscuribacterales bacterium]
MLNATITTYNHSHALPAQAHVVSSPQKLSLFERIVDRRRELRSRLDNKPRHCWWRPQPGSQPYDISLCASS